MNRNAYLISAALALALTGAAANAQASLSGIGRAKDGDSLTVGGNEVRLFGIDAPEFDQSCTRDGKAWACGAAASEQLMKLVTGRQVICLSMGTDQHQRILGRCMAGSTDINRTMVALGYAVAFRRYSTDYVAAEESAKLNKRGLWAGKFQMPSEYRNGGDVKARETAKQTFRRSSSTQHVAGSSGSCNIKGNRNRRGQWIYHLPGMPYYEQTKPEEIFCTEAEAEAAGYRRAIVK